MNSPKLLLLLVALCAALFGCGGGGGGGSSHGIITYATDWGSAPGTQSQVVILQNASGQTIGSRTMSSTENSATFSNLAFGVVRVHVSLYSGSGGTGILEGEVDVPVTVNGQETVNTALDAAPSVVKLNPPSASLFVDQTLQLAASLVTNTGVYVFAKPADFTWTATGAATVDSDGIVSGASEGNATITATHQASQVQGSAPISVLTDQIRQGKWTIMVFLNAANSLSGFAKPNIDQMEKVAYNRDVRFVIQWKSIASDYPYPRPVRALIQPNNVSGVIDPLVYQHLDDVDMGSPAALTDFVDWATAKFPADHYVLVMWSHGNGWRLQQQAVPRLRAISEDDVTGHRINVWQLAQALGNHHIDILSFDACLMQMLEVMDEVKTKVDYTVCSEDNVPGAGYRYDLVFKNFADNPNGTPRNLSKSFVDGQIQAYPDFGPISQSVVDMSQLGTLTSALDTFATTVIQQEPNVATLIPAVRQASHKFGDVGDGYEFYDLNEIAGRIKAASAVANVQTAADALQTAIANTVVWNDQLNTPSARGISIEFGAGNGFLPPASKGADYARLQLAQTTNWDEMLKMAP